MTNIFEKDKDFKAAIGAFIIGFSELEFGLAILCSTTEFDIRKRNQYLAKYLGMSFEQKRTVLKEFIKEYLPDLNTTWESLNLEIGALNKERRFIAHGFMRYYLPNENISTYIREKGKVVEKKQSIEKIDKLTQRVYHLNTGRNGINGEFHKLFMTARINQWNELMQIENRIVYTVNSKILSDWKGK